MIYRSPHADLPVAFALFAVYVIWGSTYLGAKVAVEGFPPFMMVAIRMFLAGGVSIAARGWFSGANGDEVMSDDEIYRWRQLELPVTEASGLLG